MFVNPFTPVFGGKPDFFFGRKDILARFDAALIDRGSEGRALFVTGTRGCGKTALLEQLSLRASREGWRTIDLGPGNVVETLMRHLVRQDSSTLQVAPQVSVSVLGTGGSVGGVSTSKVMTYEPHDLQIVFLEECEREKRGLFVSIDEVQKVPIEDVSAICNAFQMASRKGFDVILAIAGLPYAYDAIIHHEGCTYMRRSAHEPLGLLSREETQEAFRDAFEEVEGLALSNAGLEALVRASLGHPYMIQLLGYYLVSFVNDAGHARRYVASEDDASAVIPLAVEAYERRSLKPLMDELTPLQRDYLLAMTSVMDESHVARTADVARKLGRGASQLSRVREALLQNGIVIAPSRGRIRFNVAYLRDYVPRYTGSEGVDALVESWDI
jgi:hypothetical protein